MDKHYYCLPVYALTSQKKHQYANPPISFKRETERDRKRGSSDSTRSLTTFCAAESPMISEIGRYNQEISVLFTYFGAKEFRARLFFVAVSSQNNKKYLITSIKA